MIIRDIKREDLDAVNNLFLLVHNLHSERRPDIYKKIEKPMASEVWDYEASVAANNIMIGAEIDGKIVGFGILQICKPENKILTPRTFAYLKELCVDENYRHKGIATAIYQEGVKRAKEQGATSLELMVWNFNSAAIAFYKSLGMSVQSLKLERAL